MTSVTSDEWTPPFCSVDADELTCPECGEKECVRVHARSVYMDNVDYEAYCCECHAMLTVWAAVEVKFTDVEASK